MQKVCEKEAKVRSREKRINAQFTRRFLSSPVLSVTTCIHVGLRTEPTLKALCCQRADRLTTNASPRNLALNDENKNLHTLSLPPGLCEGFQIYIHVK